MWVAYALLSALAGAGTSLSLKRAVARGGVVESTVAFRLAAGLLLAALTLALGAWPGASPAYWRAAGMVIPPEVAGMVCLTAALRVGDLSQVQPLLGFLPLFVTLAARVTLGESPSRLGALGVALVTLGVYAVGLSPGASALEPVRALARSRAGWYAVGASLAWTLTTLVHKAGIAAVGPFAWGTTLALGSGLALLAAWPLVAYLDRMPAGGRPPAPARDAGWRGAVLVTGVCFALQQVGLHLALRAAQAGYVIAITSTSTLLATALGIAVLGERTGSHARVAASVLVSAGAAVIAIAG